AAHDALQVLIDECWRGRRWVVESDIADCFTAIPHSGLMSAVEERICDRKDPRAAARVLACGSDGGWRGPPAGQRDAAGRVCFTVARQRLPAPVGSGVASRLWHFGALRR